MAHCPFMMSDKGKKRLERKVNMDNKNKKREGGGRGGVRRLS